MMSDVLRIDGEFIADYKIHFASHNGEVEPLDEWVRSNDNLFGWQEFRPSVNDFNREYIFALMKFYPENNCWLFGGVFRVLARHHDRYEVELSQEFSEFIGRLKLYYSYTDRKRRVNFENHYERLEVGEILREPYGGRPFPGFDSVNLSFNELENIITKNRFDWRQALANAKGIYLITDGSTKKQYIGSAYGDNGIWSRWSYYVSSGHGGNARLRDFVPEADLTYCRENFRFNLLEYHLPRALDQFVIDREGYWKDVLMTRVPHGLNEN
ncbi:GIY-YIG nuclease family protein [Methylobacterium longum]|nr:GIY-YIG nuclease family protein [Methylobacterium longum]